MKAVYGGLVGNGRSSLGGRSAGAEPANSENMVWSNEHRDTDSVGHEDLYPEHHRDAGVSLRKQMLCGALIERALEQSWRG